MTPDEFKLILTNVISDAMRPMTERLEALEREVSNAISRMNAYVERRVDAMERKVEAATSGPPPGAE